MSKVFIFDLDGTVIDTRHRYRNGPDGNIDLQYWLDNSTPENISKDRLLPLAHVMRQAMAEGHTIIICTARTFDSVSGPAYLKFFQENNLPYHYLLHRQGANDLRGDGELKTDLLNQWARSWGFPDISAANPIMFDDNVKVIQAMSREFVKCFDANVWNSRMTRRKTLPDVLAA